jgi:hypothetical protein
MARADEKLLPFAIEEFGDERVYGFGYPTWRRLYGAVDVFLKRDYSRVVDVCSLAVTFS